MRSLESLPRVRDAGAGLASGFAARYRKSVLIVSADDGSSLLPTTRHQ